MDRMKAISMCVNRFDDETKTAMPDLYTKVEAEAAVSTTPPTEVETEKGDDNECPF